MVVKLFAKYGSMKGKAFEIDEDMAIGRAKSNHIVISHKLVSNKHARIFRDFDRGCYMLEDLGSLNGTILDGEAIRKPRRLGHLHVLNFGGSSDFFFVDPNQIPAARGTGIASPATQRQPPKEPTKDSSREAAKEKGNTFMGERYVSTPSIFSKDSEPKEPSSAGEKKKKTLYGQKPAAIPDMLMNKIKTNESLDQPLEALPVPFLLTMHMPGKNPHSFVIEDGENLVGRGEGLPIRIVDSQMSRHHAIIDVRKGRLFIRDLGSTNNTYVNGKAITKEMELKEGTKVGFGKLKGIIEVRNP